MTVKAPKFILLVLLTIVTYKAWSQNPSIGRTAWGLEITPDMDIPMIVMPQWYSPGLRSLPKLGSGFSGSDILLLRTGLTRTVSNSISNLVLELDYNAFILGNVRKLALSDEAALESIMETRFSWQKKTVGQGYYFRFRFVYRFNTYWGLVISLTYLNDGLY